jgi:GGDEF domain-containing protein
MELSLTAGFGVGDGASVNRKVADRAGQFFSNPDTAHERTGRGLAIILPGEGLEEAFAKAKQFHNQIMAELPELFPHKNDLRIGISSRNKRLIRANRLLLEASRALDKANLEPHSPIVAFKSDPEKYKTFVQSRQKAGGPEQTTAFT